MINSNKHDEVEAYFSLIDAYNHEKAHNVAFEAEIKALKAQIEVDKPKVLFADCIINSDSSISVHDLARLLRQNGYNISNKKLYAELHNRGFLMKAGPHRNMPTQKSFEMRVMEVHEYTLYHNNGKIKMKCTPKITGNGQVYFINLFLNQEVNQ